MESGEGKQKRSFCQYNSLEKIKKKKLTQLMQTRLLMAFWIVAKELRTTICLVCEKMTATFL